jgi:ribosome maturation factor RimP
MLLQSAVISLFLSTHVVHAFVVAPSTTVTRGSSAATVRTRTIWPLAARSLVSDPAGPTPVLDEEELETIRLEDIPETQYDPDNRPVPHQTWRRGITDGCEDPIDAPWRLEAEDLIKKSAQMVGGTVLDVTWYLTQVVIHIDDDWEKVPRDYLKTRGPQIDIMEPENPIYYDPDDPNPEPIYSDRPEDPIYIRDTTHEEEMAEKMYARAEATEGDLGLEPDKISLYTKEEYREAEALRYAEEVEQRYLREERPMEADHLKIDTAVISTIAGAIVEALETVEDRLRVLDRHEVILTSPGAADVLETQSQFDDHRGWDILIETQDPWDSNRTLRGKLVDRNSMDIILNVKGRMVTVPQNFVRCVRLPAAKRNDDYEAFAEAEEEYVDEEGGFEEEDIYE